MDADTNDSVPGIGDALNGDAKHDSSTLIQAAIMNKDVMLSGVNQQASPLSSSLALPSLSVPVTMNSSSSSVAALGDNFFLGIQPLGMTDLSELHRSDQMSGVFSPTLSNTHQQLLGQPQVAPQFLIANQTGLASPSTMPIQHLLIPVSTGNGTQQLVSIPLSLAAGLGNQMQLLATSSGQLIATNMAGLAPQLNLTIPTSSNTLQPLVMVASPLSLITNVAQNIQNLALRQLVQQQQQQQSGTSTASLASSTNIPQIITNAQGQIVAIGSPQLLQQNVMTNSSTSSSVGSTKIGQLVQQLQRSAAAVAAAAAASADVATGPASAASSTAGGGATTLTLAAAPITATVTGAPTSGTPQKALQINIAQMTQALLSAGTGVMQATGGEAVSTTGGGGAGTTGGSSAAAGGAGAGGGGGVNGVTPNINQLLPNTISSTREGTIVDGVNLDEMREFAKQFKIRRLSLGLTQTQVGQALSVTEGPSYSQSAICRFEKLDITPKSAQKIKPVLERWMAMAEERYKNGMQNLSEFIGLEPSKKRKRRTSFTPQALELLNEHFERSTHPSGAEMSKLANDLNYDREIIRIWFCNKRQVLKNTIRQLTPRN